MWILTVLGTLQRPRGLDTDRAKSCAEDQVTGMYVFCSMVSRWAAVRGLRRHVPVNGT